MPGYCIICDTNLFSENYDKKEWQYHLCVRCYDKVLNDREICCIKCNNKVFISFYFNHIINSFCIRYPKRCNRCSGQEFEKIKQHIQNRLNNIPKKKRQRNEKTLEEINQLKKQKIELENEVYNLQKKKEEQETYNVPQYSYFGTNSFHYDPSTYNPNYPPHYPEIKVKPEPL